MFLFLVSRTTDLSKLESGDDERHDVVAEREICETVHCDETYRRVSGAPRANSSESGR